MLDAKSERPDIYLGDAESSPPHWGGNPRMCFVVARPRLATGREAWRVRVEPELPAVAGGTHREVVLAPHDRDRALGTVSDGPVAVYVCVPTSKAAANRRQFRDGDLSIEYWAHIARTVEALPKPRDDEAEWSHVFGRIKTFVAEHGHSRVPQGYEDEYGRLDVIVGNIRWHHAGKAGASPGPFPGIDYAPALDALPGWEWD